ncbi:MAG TPA: hypothetical protein VGD66_04775 [Allosphingosinicella sp.]|jgi:hypothetical protein
MTDAELIAAIDQLKATMVSVATGGPRIDEVNRQFQIKFDQIDVELAARSISARPPFRDLWQWHGHWSVELPTWASRRTYVAEVLAPIAAELRNRPTGRAEPTGWARVDRAMSEARTRLAGARTEEQWQAVGLLCREVLISVAQEVHDPKRHIVTDVDRVSSTDFKRLIEAYLSVELAGSAAEEARRHARTALDLALRLQHRRTATFRDAAICVEATGAVVGIVAIVSGQRDPPP